MKVSVLNHIHLHSLHLVVQTESTDEDHLKLRLVYHKYHINSWLRLVHN